MTTTNDPLDLPAIEAAANDALFKWRHVDAVPPYARETARCYAAQVAETSEPIIAAHVLALLARVRELEAAAAAAKATIDAIAHAALGWHAGDRRTYVAEQIPARVAALRATARREALEEAKRALDAYAQTWCRGTGRAAAEGAAERVGEMLEKEAAMRRTAKEADRG